MLNWNAPTDNGLVTTSRHGDWNLEIEAAALIAVAIGGFHFSLPIRLGCRKADCSKAKAGDQGLPRNRELGLESRHETRPTAPVSSDRSFRADR
jgi:hypothetical protein